MSLTRAGDLQARVAWDAFGRSDRIGTLNFLTRERVRKAGTLVRIGKTFPLNWRLEWPDPAMFGRTPLRHTRTIFPTGTDDFYDGFYPQGSSQWDALSHIGHPTLGYYGGRTHAEIADQGSNPLGIEQWARRGIAGRFVLVDVARHRAGEGRALDHAVGTPIEVDELETIMRAQGVQLEGGDILLLRFGWVAWYASVDARVRSDIATMGHKPTPGLSQREATASWLWDARVAAVVADNPGVERYPADPNDLDAFLHYRLITFLGMALGELFDLDALAADCAADGIYEGLFTAAPLNKAGGSGSTANAIALK